MLRLKKLWAKDYKNLKDLTIDFERGDGFSMLIGTNGSGKSNVLELLSGIFHDAYMEDSFTIESDYRIEYELEGKTVVINKTLKRRQFRINNILQKRISFIHQQALPKNVVAIYSGEESRLWDNFYEYFYSQYIRNTNNTSKHTEEMKLIYVNKFYWNIALFIMIFSENADITSFKESLNIQIPKFFQIKFNSNNIKKSRNLLLKNFISSVNENNKDTMKIKFPQMKRRITNLNLPDSEIFKLLIQSNLPKREKLIDDVYIEFQSGISTRDLSEGEKKLILVQAVLEFLSDEKTLLLFDEPDSHINESKKISMYHLMRKYTQAQIIVTTHSPTLTQVAKNSEKIILKKDEKNNVGIVTCSDIEAIERISDGLLTGDVNSIIFISQKPLILVEGPGDVAYIKRAVEVLSSENSKYSKIDCEYLFYGGTGNAREFMNNIQNSVSKQRKVIVIFDRDEAGGKGIKECIGKGNNRERDHGIYKYENFYYFMLPTTLEYKNDKKYDFLIEDYFSKAKKNEIVMEQIKSADGHFNGYIKDMRDHLKHELEKFRPNATAEDLAGFKVLLDRIYDIIEETTDIKVISNTQEITSIEGTNFSNQ